MKMYILRYKKIFFFIIIYAISLPFWILQIFINKNNLPLDIPITDIFTAFTPLLSAIILLYMELGKTGIKSILKRILNYKNIGMKWFVVIIAIPMIIFLLIYFILHIFYINSLPNEYKINVLMLPLLLIFFFFGAVAEETGYMGYEYDKLEKDFGMLKSALLIGIIWTIWHFPSMLEQGRGLKYFIWGSLGTISYRIIYVILYKRTNNNLSVCILSHTLYNFFRALFPNEKSLNPLIQFPEIHYSIIILITIIVIIIDKIKTKRNCT